MKSPSSRAFTLIELLVVVAIMGVLAAVSIPAMQSMGGAGQFNQAVSSIAGLLELARSQAIAQNTYTWVVLWQNNPAANTPADNNSGYEIYAAAYLSNDGTDPFSNWSGNVTVPSPGLAPNGTTTLLPIARVLNDRQTGLILTAAQASTATGHPLPNLANATTPGFLASPANSSASAAPNFHYTAKTGTSTATLSSSSIGYGVVEFTPSGAARNSASPVESIWFGLYPIKGKLNTGNIPNLASLKVNGLTGLVTVYRP